MDAQLHCLRMVNDHHIILASNSPRRQQLLADLGIKFEVRTLPDIDETWPTYLQGQDIPLYISAAKAEAYRPTMADDELLITADTIVYHRGQVLGKPHSHDEATHMLRSLAGHTHEVITAVTLATKHHSTQFADTTLVTFSDLSDAEIEYYIDNYKPYDKAGAYGIQEWIGHIAVAQIQGSYTNVMGLPTQKLYARLCQICASSGNVRCEQTKQ